MNIDKNKSIRKGFALSKILFPVVGGVLLVTQMGCSKASSRVGMFKCCMQQQQAETVTIKNNRDGTKETVKVFPNLISFQNNTSKKSTGILNSLLSCFKFSTKPKKN